MGTYLSMRFTEKPSNDITFAGSLKKELINDSETHSGVLISLTIVSQATAYTKKVRSLRLFRSTPLEGMQP